MTDRQTPRQFVGAIGAWLPDKVAHHRESRRQGVIEMAGNGSSRRPQPRLRSVRHAVGLDRTELAARAGIDYAALVLLENGLLSPDELPGEALSRLVAILDTPAGELFAVEEPHPPRATTGDRPSAPHLVRKEVTWFYSASYERLPDEQERLAWSVLARRLRRLGVALIVGLLLASFSSDLPEVGYWTGVWVVAQVDWYRLYYSVVVIANAAWRGLGTFGEWTLTAQTRVWQGTPVALRPALGVAMAAWFALSLIGLLSLVEPGRLVRRLLPRRATAGLQAVQPDMAPQSSGGG
jgi:transcriptional regulator with XRE-family HTH domain